MQSTEFADDIRNFNVFDIVGVESTIFWYAHFVDEMRKDAATKMDAILDSVAVKAPDTKVT